MQNLLFSFTKKSYLGRAIRTALVASIMIFTMLMSIFMPVADLFYEIQEEQLMALANEKERAKFLNNKNLLSGSSSDFYKNKNQEKEELYQYKDQYTNRWDEQNKLESYIVQEEISLRTANQKHFRMSDGSYIMVSHSQPIHYYENGEYKEIDNTLVRNGNVYVNKSNPFKVEFPAIYSKSNLTNISYGQYRLSFKLNNFTTVSDAKLTIENRIKEHIVKAANEKKYFIKNNSQTKYQFNNRQVELEQILVGNELKENIILNEKLESYNFEFSINTKNLRLVLQNNGDIHAISKTSEQIIFTIPKGYMYDNLGTRSDNVEYILSESAFGYRLQVIGDKNWINDPQRVFPVTIDPSISMDTAIEFKSASDGNIVNGLMPVNVTTKSFLDFTLPEVLNKAVILNGTLKLYAQAVDSPYIAYLSLWENLSEFNDNTPPSDNKLEIPKEDGSEEKTTVYTNYYYNPNNQIPPYGKINIAGTTLQQYEIDITYNLKSAVDFNNFEDYHGFAFSIEPGEGSGVKIANEDYANSECAPVVQIQYRNMVGIESYWDYEQYSIGSNDVFINNYNDELTVVHTDAVVNAVPALEVQHIYMDSYSDINFDVDSIFGNGYFGYGWKLNYQQIIRGRGNGNFEYYDADGTMHYFYHDAELTAEIGHNVAKDEDGLGFTLNTYASNYKLVDVDQNEKWFDYHGRMYKMVNANGNTINIIYGNGNQPRISDIPITEINNNNGSAVTFTYNTEGYLTTINYKRADGITIATTTFTYNENKISKIVQDNGTFTEYGYASNRLQTLKIESGYQLHLRSDVTGVFSLGIDRVYGYLEVPKAQVRSVWQSVGQEEVHIRDTVYCHGLTLSVTSKTGEDYVPYSSIQTYYDMNQEAMESHYAGMSSFEKALFLLTIGWAYAIMYGYNNIDPYLDTCKDYYSNNYRIKKCYDIAGRLVSSYTDEYGSMSVNNQYENVGMDETNVNNNKVNAVATYVSNLKNNIGNPSFEVDTQNWNISNSSVPYKRASVSTRYASHGKQSLEMFVAQSSSFSVSQAFLVMPGNYTVSGYIRVDTMLIPKTINEEYGAYIYVANNDNNLLGRCEYVSEDIYINNNGFKKVVFTFNNDSTLPATFKICLAMENCSGFVYFDQIQVVMNQYGIVDTFNNAVNSDFLRADENSSTSLEGWNLWTDITNDMSFIDVNISGEGATGLHYVELSNDGSGSVNLYQQVPLENNSQSVAYTISVWMSRAYNYYLTAEDAYIGLNYRLFDENMNPLTGFHLETLSMSFAVWYQFAQTFVAPPEAKYVEINIQMNKVIGTIFIDNVSLIQSKIINLEYDQFGNCSYYSDGYNKYSFNEENEYVGIGINGVINYGVTKDEKGNIIASNDLARQVKMEYDYDDLGRVTEEIFSTKDNSLQIGKMTNYSFISNNLQNIVTDIDSLGFQTINNVYAYSDLLLKTTFNDGTYIEYDYGSGSGNFAAVPATVIIRNKDFDGTVLHTIKYNYMTIADAISNEEEYGCRHVGSLKSVEMANGTVYSYRYDQWGNVKNVLINGNIHISYNYNDKGLIISKTLTNGYTEFYYYDALSRLVEMVAKSQEDTTLKNYRYEYALSGNLLSAYDMLNKELYLQQYDQNQRTLLYAQGKFNFEGNVKVPVIDFMSETLYSYYGDVEKTNEVFIGAPSLSLALTPKSYSGNLTRSRIGVTETVSIGGAPKIIYTYNSANLTYGKVVQEDNSLLKNANYPNGVRLKYARDSFGRILSITISPYGTNNNEVVYNPRYAIKTQIDEFEGGYEALWNIDWMQNNAPSLSSYPVSALPDEENNGMQITNIIKLHPGSFYTSANGYYSLVDPTALMMGVLGDEITFWAKVLEAAAGSTNIMIPRVRYADNTIGTAKDYVANTAVSKIEYNGLWQFFSIPINPDKTVVSLELPWYQGAWLAVGNMNLFGRKDAWNSDWTVNNVVNSNYPVSRLAAQKVDSCNIVTDIIRIHQESYYKRYPNGTGALHSLVDPDLLVNGGGSIILNYQARIDTLNSSFAAREDKDTLIGGLRFRYSDGTADYGGHPHIAYTTAWQSVTIVSEPDKQVIGIELGYNYGSWIQLGNVNVTVQNLGRIDGRINAQILSDQSRITYQYDQLGRLSNTELFATQGADTALMSESYDYLDGSDNNTSYQIVSKDISYGETNGITYNYTYNLDNPALGSVRTERSHPYNIWQIKEGNVVKVEYNYDKLGRIIRENNSYSNQTVTYVYDENYNIISKTIYPYTTSPTLAGGTTVTYTYNDPEYKDRLTAYNGENIAYDALGNPTQYRGNNLVWRGRELIGYQGVAFEYNMEGMRTEKGDVSFIYVGSILTQEQSIDHTIDFLYGQNGLIGFELDGTSYFYIKNLFGDITGIIDNTGTLVVQYSYDTWGKVLAVTGTMAATVGALNPIRYRGYYYDSETGLYYLQSRYYDPETGRFISPDKFEYIGAGSATANYNLYAYCENNPVKYSDSEGNYAIGSYLTGLGISTLIGALAGAVSYTISRTIDYALSGNFDWSWGEFAGATVGGAITGAATYVVPSIVTTFIGGGLSTAGGMMLGNALNETDYSAKEIAVESMESSFYSAISAGIMPKIKIDGLTAGRGSYLAISKQIVTKFKRGLIKRITPKTFCKMFGYELYANSLATLLEGIN